MQTIKYRGAVYRRVTAAKTVMYHGTATGRDGEILRSILKRGLVPDPKQRAFDSTDPLYESYPGIYFSPNYATAESYAEGAVSDLGGRPVVVAVQIEDTTSTIRLDEDVLEPADFWLADVLKVYRDDEKIKKLSKQQHHDYVVEIARRKFNALQDQYGLRLTSKQRDNLLPSLTKLIQANTRYMLAWTWEKELTNEAHSKYRYQYRKAMEQFLRELHNVVKRVGANNVRITEPVGYRGSNRILAVVQLDPPKVLYNRDNSVVRQIAQEAWGVQEKTAGVLVTAAKTVMYHGTSAGPDGKLLTRILKEGMNPTPKKKIYDSPEGDYDLEWETELSISLDESFGGVYLTNKLGRAKTYADHASHQRGGDRILVAVQVETRSPGTAIDEDLVFRNAFDFVDRWLDTDTWYATDVLIESGDVDWHQLAKDYLTDYLNLKLHPNRIDTVVPPLAEALKGIYRFHLYRDYEREIEQGYAEAGDEYFGFDSGVVEDALSDYRHYGNIVTQKLREMVEPKTKALYNIRFTTPISYRGTNRIIAVVSGDPEGAVQTIHYAADQQVADQLASVLKARRSNATP